MLEVVVWLFKALMALVVLGLGCVGFYFAFMCACVEPIKTSWPGILLGVLLMLPVIIVSIVLH